MTQHLPLPTEPFIANTDPEWFDFLSRVAVRGTVDEANFWSPRSRVPLKTMSPGQPVFLRLKHPTQAIAGYGFFAHFRVLRVDLAWQLFAYKNGAECESAFLERIARLRQESVDMVRRAAPEIGCTILRGIRIWPDHRWIPYSTPDGWKVRSMRGATEADPLRAARLLDQIRFDAVSPPSELVEPFALVTADERAVREASLRPREGQGTFRARLLDAYHGCAITGERTELVLEAAHIQPYLGPRSNHLQNGVLLTREFHTLFDRGYVGVAPDLTVMISPRLRKDWQNGTRYYAYDNQPLRRMPERDDARPSAEALAWHRQHVFLG